MLNSNSSSATLADLTAINREIAAMVRAGIPLELGLRTFAGDIQSRLSRLANRIADKLAEGQSLAQAVESEGARESPVYAAVISAGLQSGQLSEALEAVASSAELVRETRTHLARSMIYPVIVLVLAYTLFAAFIWFVAPRYIETAEMFGFANSRIFELMGQIHDAEPIWVWLVPLGAILLVVATRGIFHFNPLSPLFFTRLLSRAQFAELLKIQVNHGLPIGPAFRRAAAGSGDPGLRRVADAVCRDVDQGIPFSTAITEAKGLPPLMAWMIATGARQGTLTASLGLVGESCRRRAARQAYYLKVWLPILVTLIIGGSVVMLYGLLNFIPLRAFWDGLMIE